MIFTKEELDAARSRVDELWKQASENPETRVELEKLGFSFGNLFPSAQELGRTAATAATVGATFGGINAAIKGIDSLIGNFGEAKRKSKAYEEMVSANPSLEEYGSEKAHAAFNTLYKFNPEYASDPLVASEFVGQVLETERVPLQSINELVKSRANMGRGSGGIDLFNPISPMMGSQIMGRSAGGESGDAKPYVSNQVTPRMQAAMKAGKPVGQG